ncbi:MAG: sterol desaturase family protein [Flavipsychrobacter sp.]|nr:sterol desaturase family protein [Flavipsychrobacter sp.]
MFRNPFLEACSKVHYTVPLFIYIPVVFYFIAKSIFVLHTKAHVIFICFFLGIIVWSFVEYVLHRFVFHFTPKSKLYERIHFIFHGVHHSYPNDVKRLVMPPSVSLPLAFAFYFIFKFLFNPVIFNTFFPGFVTGYLIYDMSHYALHHFNFRTRFFKGLKRNHMLHHYQDASKRFGVSSVLWDKIFHSDK